MSPVVGKRGKRRRCQLRERTANERNNSATPAIVRGDDARGRLVAPPPPRVYWIVDFHCLFHMGGFPGEKLFLWQLPLAVLFARTVWQFAAQLVWTEACMVARLAHLFPCALNSLGAGRVPAHLLLLSWCLLQSFLG